ncbi:MAG: T9SS type A sorting domain-containing protein, partial [candidate division Zixibacteria bacterium]|nr:T9SS type A sorting domain-containing protein [candidate division Zixibacteria bacterium]
NATVDEIKTAILTSTRWSSAWGETPNNHYGWGEIDCWAALEALSETNSQPNVRLYDFDQASINPGDTVRGSVILQNLGLTATSVTAQVLAGNSALTILDGFLSFGTISTNDTVRSSNSLSVIVADTTTLGTILSADFAISGNDFDDTVRIHFLVGTPPGKATATHTGRIDFTLTDYGVFGLGPGSLFPLNGVGFTFDDGSNDLWEAGVMIGTSYSRVSSGVHSYIYEPNMDFQASPGGAIELLDPGPVAVQQTYAVFDDGRAKNPIGLQIQQESFTYNSPDDDFVILKYILKNISDSTLSDLYFGLFLDFDIYSYISNAGGYETDGEFVWMAYNSVGNLSRFRGAKLLQGPLAAAGAIDYDTYYHWPAGSYETADGLSTDEKFGALTSGFLHANTNKTSKEDLFMILSAGPLMLAPDQLDTLKFAIMAGDSLADLRDVAERAALAPTPVDEPGGEQILPATFALHQNYPNPFNPSTVISFDLPRKSKYRLEIINMLGQTLYETEAIASAGRIEIEWNGEGYASGAYLYRVTVDDRSVTRKMMLLK